MAVTNKCNITKYALAKYNAMKYGFSCEDVERPILENYIVYLNCATVNIVVCSPDNCVNDPIVNTCSLRITDINVDLAEDNPFVDLIFGANIVGGNAPFHFQWSYNIDDFDVYGPTDTFSLSLKGKPGKDVSYLNSVLGVTITDRDGCTDTKSCFYTPDQMECADDFIDCPNIIDLTINTH